MVASPPELASDTYFATYPLRTADGRLRIRQEQWARVLQQWGRGLRVPVLLPLAATEPSSARAEVVRHLRDARQKIDGADYSGSCTESRKALELLLKLNPATSPMPKDPKDRDVAQRVHAVLQALHSLASASMHTDAPIKDFRPQRADAVAIVAGTASAAQQVFARLDQ